MIVRKPEFSSMDGHISLASRIAAVHVAYHSSESQIFWFGQLVSQLPGILKRLKDTVPSESDEMVHKMSTGIAIIPWYCSITSSFCSF